MAGITVTNNSSGDIQVSVTATGGDFQKGGSETWYTIKAGASDTWNYRDQWQIVRFTRSNNAGATVESVIGIPGKTANIY
ncbi:hypothetical protein GYMLUDRAFT_213303 [Collybiopsis luxurians FD-317 M1]|nr:hypothetical protein GYMLUDRAFT_213303 [Collybiopsis luxurians FD-317 M1]